MIWRFLILRPDGPAAIAFIQPVALLRMGGQSSVGSQNSKAEIQKAEIGKWGGVRRQFEREARRGGIHAMVVFLSKMNLPGLTSREHR